MIKRYWYIFVMNEVEGLELADWSKFGYESENDAIQAVIEHKSLYVEYFILSSIVLRED